MWRAVGARAGLAQDLVPGGVVRDHHHHLLTRDQLPDVLGLRLGERGAAAVVAGRGGAARPHPAPEVTVVSVEVDALIADAAGSAAVLSVPLGGGCAFGGAETVAVPVRLARLAREVEAIRVHDRHDDRPDTADERASARIARAVAAHQLVRPLQRVLGRGPFIGVVHPELEVDRLAVARARVGGDLETLHRPPFPARVPEREQLHEIGVGGGERLHLVAVIRETPVCARASARQCCRPRHRPRGRGGGCVSEPRGA